MHELLPLTMLTGQSLAALCGRGVFLRDRDFLIAAGNLRGFCSNLFLLQMKEEAQGKMLFIAEAGFEPLKAP